MSLVPPPNPVGTRVESLEAIAPKSPVLEPCACVCFADAKFFRKDDELQKLGVRHLNCDWFNPSWQNKARHTPANEEA